VHPLIGPEREKRPSLEVVGVMAKLGRFGVL